MPKPHARAKAQAKPDNRQPNPTGRRRGGNPNPPPPPVEYQFRPGQSGNPGGRPKIMSDAYRRMLAEVDEKTGMTKAEVLARARYIEALGEGGTPAAREIRQATEGDRERTWEDDVIEALRSGTIDADTVRAKLPASAERLIALAGIKSGDSDSGTNGS